MVEEGNTDSLLKQLKGMSAGEISRAFDEYRRLNNPINQDPVRKELQSQGIPYNRKVAKMMKRQMEKVEGKKAKKK